MFLPDNELRDIIKYLEAGKPLPDKYRFLLFENKREIELLWNGKTDDVTNTVLPFQVIEQVDEPRSETKKALQDSLFDTSGRQRSGWTNKLIWGDNKLILSSLKNGPLRQEIEAQGGLKLIYIDPPFDVGADFSMKVEIGDEEFTKEPSVLEELAYRDTWGKGADSFIAMIYERLILMHDLLADNGTIYVHCDWRVNSLIKLVLDEIFGKSNLINEIVWKRTSARSDSHKFNHIHDTIYIYHKGEDFVFNDQYIPHTQEYQDKYFSYKESDGRRYATIDATQAGVTRGESGKAWRGFDPSTKGNHWKFGVGKLDELDAAGRIYWPQKEGGWPRLKSYLDEQKGSAIQTLWTDVKAVNSQAKERIDYPTQKPESLIERIIASSSNEGDLVADFFCGSGTTLAVAEKLGRKWLGSDLGKFSIHTTRKRMINVQRDLKKDSKDYRAFEILNLGKYERQHFIGVNPNLREEEKQKQLAQKEKDFVSLILGAYKAEAFDGFKTFHGKKSSRLVAIGPINLPVSRLFVDAVIKEAIEKSITKIDVLAFEFEMGLFPNIQEEAKNKGIDLALKYIPRDVFDKRAIEKNQVVFHDVSYIEVKPVVKKSAVAIELTDFSVFYNQDSIKELEENMKAGGKKVIVENGQIIKVSKDKDGIMSREVLTKKWTDWIDYWAIDYNFESKKEIVRVKNEETGEYEEAWTGSYVFENEWQTFRTKKDRSLELTSAAKELGKGKHKIAIKVVDIFGNDTMKIIDLTV